MCNHWNHHASQDTTAVYRRFRSNLACPSCSAFLSILSLINKVCDISMSFKIHTIHLSSNYTITDIPRCWLQSRRFLIESDAPPPKVKICKSGVKLMTEPLFLTPLLPFTQQHRPNGGHSEKANAPDKPIKTSTREPPTLRLLCDQFEDPAPNPVDNHPPCYPHIQTKGRCCRFLGKQWQTVIQTWLI